MVFFVRITVNQSHLRPICKSTKFNPKIQRTIYSINFQRLRLHVLGFIRTVVLLDVILSKNYELLHAWNGKEAVEMFEQQKPELVLMDITMPVMNGYEATSEIRKFSATVPIIGLTARAFSDDEQEGYDCGMTEYMTKPINIVQLRMHISKLLG